MIEQYNLGPDKYTKSNIYWGMTGEKVVAACVRGLFRVRDGYKVISNKFKSIKDYCSGSGMDITVRNLYAFEVKNFKIQKKPYGTDFVRRHVLPRAKGVTVQKILVITYIKLLTRQAISLLRHNGWKIVEVGERLDYSFFRDTRKLYKLRASLRKILFSSLFSQSYTRVKLSNYSSPNSNNKNKHPNNSNIKNKHNTNINNKHTINSNITNKHDTPCIGIGELCYSQYVRDFNGGEFG